MGINWKSGLPRTLGGEWDSMAGSLQSRKLGMQTVPSYLAIIL